MTPNFNTFELETVCLGMYLGSSLIDNGVLGHAVWKCLEAQCLEGDFGPCG